MELSKIFLNSFDFKTDMSSQTLLQTDRKNKNFESYLESSKKNQQINNNERQNKDRKFDNSNIQPKRQQTKKEQSSDNKQPQSKQTQKSENTKTVEQKKTNTPDDKDKIEQQIVKNLSEELDVPEEQITQILNTLNITPLDLLQHENKSNFVKQMFQVDDQLKLLTMPNIKETFEAIDNALKQFTDLNIDEVTNNFQSALDLHIDDDLNTELEENVVFNDNFSNKKNDSSDKKFEKSEQLPEMENIDELSTVNQSNTANDGSQQQSSNNLFSSGMQATVETNEQSNISTVDSVTHTITTSSGDSITIEKTVTTSKNSQSVSQSNILNQITEKIKIDFKPNLTEMKIMLRPQDLGEITLKISTENGVITASFLAENERIKELIQSNFDVLESALSEQGISVSQLTVNVGTNSSEQRMNHFNQNRQKSRRRIEQILNNITDEVVEDANYTNSNDLSENSVDFSA